jgi:tetratricopeptide (TPR) repeat protein
MSVLGSKARRRRTLIAAATLVFSMAASLMALRRVDQLRPQATLDDVLYVNSPKVVKRASLGYDGLMACIYWTRAVQYFGNRHHDGAQSYPLLAPLLEITTTLDPHLIVAYQFGASFLAPNPPAGAGQPERAIQLMEYGIQNNPNDWHLYYNLGFVYYTELHDYAKASQTFERGSRVANAHPFLKVMAAQMAQHAGEFETARMLWTATYESTQDKEIKRNAVEHLRALRVDEDASRLQAAVTRFGERTGRLPSSMYELAAAEGLRGIPVDPDGHPYNLTQEGHVLVEHPDDFPFITKGVPPGYKPASPKFHDQH